MLCLQDVDLRTDMHRRVGMDKPDRLALQIADVLEHNNEWIISATAASVTAASAAAAVAAAAAAAAAAGSEGVGNLAGAGRAFFAPRLAWKRVLF